METSSNAKKVVDVHAKGSKPSNAPAAGMPVVLQTKIYVPIHVDLGNWVLLLPLLLALGNQAPKPALQTIGEP